MEIASGVSMHPDEFSALLGRIYDSALEPERWPETMEAVARACGWNASTLQVVDLRERKLIDAVITGMPPEIVDDFRDHYVKVDPRAPALEVQPGSIVTDAHVLSETEMDRHEFYADFMAKYGFRYFSGVMLHADGPVQTAVSLQRSARQGPATAAEVALLEALAPHFRRAVRLAVELGAAKLRADSALEALERLSIGVAILDDVGSLVHANAALRGMAATRDGIHLDPIAIRFGHLYVQSVARKMIAGALATAGGQELGAGGTFHVSRPSGRRPYVVAVSPLLGRSRTMFAPSAAAVLLVKDPELIPTLPGDMLRALYKLTSREAELALIVSDGTPLVRAAERLGMTEGTARVHMTSILAKTGTTRQAELVSLLARLTS
jgi:DNA-binding CsgD family transcriptional regulator